MSIDAEVVVVGGGVAGGLVAEQLLAVGVQKLVILEAGPPVPMRDPRLWLDVVTTGVTPYAKLYDDPSDFVAKGPNPWNIVGGRLFGRGGSTLHWGGWAPRFMPEDFLQSTNTGRGCDWPYGYADLEPYYVQAEHYLQVAGDVTPDQRDWRSAPYPMAAAALPMTAGPIVQALDRMGVSYQHMPVARNTVAINDQPQCMTNGTCGYCPIGGRFTADQAFDRLSADPRVTLITNAAATQVVMASKSRAGGVNYLDLRTGETVYCAAASVFVCCGAFEAPKLLQASVSRYWPAGLGNDNGLVGAFLVANPYIYCTAQGGVNPELLQQELFFPTLCSRQFDTPEEQPFGKFLMNMAEESPFLTPGTMIYDGLSPAQIGAAVQGPVTYQLQGALSAFGYRENTVGLAPGTTRFGLPRTAINTPTDIVPASGISRNLGRMKSIFQTMGLRITASGSYPQRGDHSASTCRMSLSPSTGVVDPALRVWGVDNVFVASNAAVPAIGAANITLTLVAMILKAFEVYRAEGLFGRRGATAAHQRS